MNPKEHWKNEHAAGETFHQHRSRRYADRSETNSSIADYFAEEGSDEVAARFRKLADIDKSLSSVEAERADHHRQAAVLVDSMETNQPYTRKAAGVRSDADDLSKLVPDHVRGIIGEIPEVRMIPRAGQPIPERQNVSPELQKFAANPEDENSLY
jgi:hypothetical protein